MKSIKTKWGALLDPLPHFHILHLRHTYSVILCSYSII